MSKKSKIIEDMRDKIKLEEYGLENVSITHIYFKLYLKTKMKYLLFVALKLKSRIVQTFPIHTKAMTTAGILKNLKRFTFSFFLNILNIF